MSKYKELVKNFDMLRNYAYDFYVNGYKTRENFNYKSLRSYDDVRRRVGSYLSEYNHCEINSKGKSVCITIDGQNSYCNPLHKLFKTKSFTKNDVTLHYVLIDVLRTNDKLNVKEIVEIMDDEYFYGYDDFIVDTATVRNKLNDYCDKGIFCCEYEGKELKYYYEEKQDISKYNDVINFYTIDNPLGVIGSYFELENNIFTFKHEYLQNVLGSEIIFDTLYAIKERQVISVKYYSVNQQNDIDLQVFPIKILYSTTGGRSYVFCFDIALKKYISLRVEKIREVICLFNYEEADQVINDSKEILDNMWGAAVNDTIEYVRLRINCDEKHILNRLNREKRNGKITHISGNVYEYYTTCYEGQELLPWIRTYMGRVISLETNNKNLKHDFYEGVAQLKELYEVDYDI